MKLVLVFAVISVVAFQVSAQQGANLFTNLSDRAATVVFAMVFEAKQRGAAFIDVNDLVIALIAEDHDSGAPMLFKQEMPSENQFRPGAVSPTGSGKKREPFFPPKVAVDVLITLNQILPRSSPIPNGTGHGQQMSPALERVIAVAQSLPSEFQQSQVQVNFGTPQRPKGMYQAVVPLDLLAAALREPCEGTKILEAAGITEEKVTQILRSGGDLENGSFHLEPSSAVEKNP
jgi:hypothetical protein